MSAAQSNDGLGVHPKAGACEMPDIDPPALDRRTALSPPAGRGSKHSRVPPESLASGMPPQASVAAANGLTPRPQRKVARGHRTGIRRR
eukprot:5326191-Pyramimonas_sp.AAC.1